MIKKISKYSYLELFDLFIRLLLIASPIFLMTIRGWTNGILFLLFILTAFGLIQFKSLIPQTFSQPQRSSIKLIIASLAIGFFVILITQVFREEITLKAFDAPLRMLLCIPIFLYLCHKPLNIAKAIPYVISLSFLATFIYIIQHPEIPLFWDNRFATKPVDPNAFGVYATLMLALLLFSINLNYLFNQKFRLIITISGLILGTYLVIGSGTRGAWLSIPFLVIAWALVNIKSHTKTTLALASGVILGYWISYENFIDFQSRIDSGFYEIHSWLFTTTKDTSAGIRLSMWQVTWELVQKNPFAGYGDSGYQHLLNNQNLTGNYSPIVIEIIAKAGPHNEYIANLLRSGIFGGLAIFIILFAPLFVYIKSLFQPHFDSEKIFHSKHLGLALFLCLAISSMSVEVFNLKYTSSFYGLLIAMIYSQIITEQSANTNEQK